MFMKSGYFAQVETQQASSKFGTEELCSRVQTISSKYAARKSGVGSADDGDRLYAEVFDSDLKQGSRREM